MWSKHDPHQSEEQFIEDMATAYWKSEILFTAVELDLFSMIEKGTRTAKDLSSSLKLNHEASIRFLNALVYFGLLEDFDGEYYNTRISSNCLVKESINYQGENVLWRKSLRDTWQDLSKILEKGGRVIYPSEDQEEQGKRIEKYIKAMDCVARNKAEEIQMFFEHTEINLKLLDVGSGSGVFSAAFLNNNKNMEASLIDLDFVNDYASGQIDPDLKSRIKFMSMNILEPWGLEEKYDIIILSNIIHAYSEKEIKHILKNSAAVLGENGLIIAHDFFFEHRKVKAALTDLNMMANTYNGRVYSYKDIKKISHEFELISSELIPLETDTAVIFLAKNAEGFEKLNMSNEKKLMAKLRELNFENIQMIDPQDIKLTSWARAKCGYGCSFSGSFRCEKNGEISSNMNEILNDYSKAIIIQDEPPTSKFQRKVIKAEKEAFKMNYYKVLSFWAGPCTICNECEADSACMNPGYRRPSMEGAGIDVFATAEKAGLKIKTINEKTDYVKYFALLLLE